MARIVDSDHVIKDMKECWHINKQKVISGLKKSKIKEVHDILELSENCATEDEKGMLLLSGDTTNNIIHGDTLCSRL